jgi:hypothetical protein
MITFSPSSTAFVIFLSGLCLGALLEYGGRNAVKRVQARQALQVPLGYVSLHPEPMTETPPLRSLFAAKAAANAEALVLLRSLPQKFLFWACSESRGHREVRIFHRDFA